MSKYGTTHCPICEKHVADSEVWQEYATRLSLLDGDDTDPQLVAWADTFCWHEAMGGYDHDGSHDEEATMKKLILTLNQRDSMVTILEADTETRAEARVATEKEIAHLKAELQELRDELQWRDRESAGASAQETR